MALCVASVNLSSCVKNGDNGNKPSGPRPSECKPGDDFYTYANAEWLESIEGADPQKTYGFYEDVVATSDKRIESVKAAMSEYKLLKKTAANNHKNADAAMQLAEEVTKELLNVESREDIYVAFGRAIRMGVSSIATLHTGICREDNTFGYYFLPPVSDMEGAVESSRHVASKRLSRYMPSTRSGKTTIDYVLEGIGLDPKYYLHSEISDEIVAILEQVDEKELLKNIGEATLMELVGYCTDEYAYGCSGGVARNVQEYLDMYIDEHLGYYISYYYSKKYPTDSVEAAFAALGDEIVASFRERLEHNEWLSPATRQAAIEKLECVGRYYGTPKKWPLTEMLQLEGKLLVADVLKVMESRSKIIESLLGKSLNEYLPIHYMCYSPFDSIYSYTVNAFYDSAINSFYVLPAFMQEPIYAADMDECKMYAIIATTIGHEITHGFDQTGATYDKYGEQKNWWTEGDAAKFAELNALRAANVSTHEIMPGMPANGEQTVTEDVADLGGFNTAYDLWVNKLKERGVTGDELIEQKKKFFLCYAAIYSEKMPAAEMIERAEKDVHSAGHIRINSVVQHIDDWYELFDVVEGDALYLAPEQRITIW